MSVHLQKIRFFATTKDESDAGTDSGVILEFFVNSHSRTTFLKKGWNQQNLDHSWDDRERGRTEMYEVDFRVGEPQRSPKPLPPRGIAFNNLVHARTGLFRLRMKGDDWWKIDHYYLLGYFKEFPEVPSSYAQTIDHGWLLMARHDGDIDLSTDPSEGAPWHVIDLNGTF